MKKLLIIILFLFGCAPASLRSTVVLHETTLEMQGLYNPFIEIGFCLDPNGEIYNIQNGGWMTSPLPLCRQDAIVMHTHPVWAEPFANIADYLVWKEYKKRYGNEYYGIMKQNWYKVYHIQGEL